jgi:hypothetical protein
MLPPKAPNPPVSSDYVKLSPHRKQNPPRGRILGVLDLHASVEQPHAVASENPRGKGLVQAGERSIPSGLPRGSPTLFSSTAAPSTGALNLRASRAPRGARYSPHP